MVEFINYKDEKLPISVNMDGMRQLEKEDLELGGDDNMQALERLFWHSLKAGHFYEGRKLEIKEEDIHFYFGYCFDEFEACMNLFLVRREELKKKPTVKERLKK